MKTDNLSQTDEDVFSLKFSDDDLEASAGNPTLFPLSPVRCRCAPQAVGAALGRETERGLFAGRQN